jgi:hypothetical protein
MRITILFLLLPTLLFAQEFEFRQEYDTIPVEIDGWHPYAPWIGGIRETNPAITDIDADGNLDFFVGQGGGTLYYFKNEGNPVYPNFNFITYQFDSIDVGWVSNPCFRDMDADGDYDIIIGDGQEHVYFFRNIGTPQSPNYVQVTDTLVPYPPDNWGPELVDIDSDGDYDLFCGYYQITYYENTGTPEDFEFTLVTDNFEGITLSGRSTPEFVDIDGDSDFDLFIGERNGCFWFYRNDGDSAN